MEEKVYEYLNRLVSVPGISDTDEERKTAEAIREIIAEQPHFKAYPENFGTVEIPGDARKRPLVYGLVRGNKKSGRTIILTGHYDVVSVEDYGQLKPLAFSMDELKAELEKEYGERVMRAPEKTVGKGSMEDGAKVNEEAGERGEVPEKKTFWAAADPEQDFWNDVASGEWIFGRGAADMKGGLAAGLAVLLGIGEEVLDGTCGMDGNVLFLSVPDEESYSVGMRGAAGFLAKLREQEKLSYELLIDLEPMSRDENGQEVFLGSVGKCMPVVLVQGRTAHVSRCFDGLNAVGVLGRMFEKTELSEEFAEVFDGEVCMPPTWLNFKDLKKEYDVSVPARAAGYLSVLSFRSGPGEILEKMRELGSEAFAEYIEKMDAESRRLEEKLSGRAMQGKKKCIKTAKPQAAKAESVDHTDLVSEEYADNVGECEKTNDVVPQKFNVLSFEELSEQCRKKNADGFEDFLEGLKVRTEARIRSGETNYPQATIDMMTEVLDWSGLTDLVMVIGFAPPLYPAYHSDQMTGKEGAGSWQFRKIKKASEAAGCMVKKVHYFTGISDLSYCGTCGDMDFSGYAAETPIWGGGYQVDFEEIGKLNIPAVLMGPWGKDIHRRTERVNRKSLLVELPEILHALIEDQS